MPPVKTQHKVMVNLPLLLVKKITACNTALEGSSSLSTTK